MFVWWWCLCGGNDIEYESLQCIGDEADNSDWDDSARDGDGDDSDGSDSDGSVEPRFTLFWCAPWCLGTKWTLTST